MSLPKLGKFGSWVPDAAAREGKHLTSYLSVQDARQVDRLLRVHVRQEDGVPAGLVEQDGAAALALVGHCQRPARAPIDEGRLAAAYEVERLPTTQNPETLKP